MSIEGRLGEATVVRVARGAEFEDGSAWIVGGAVRDAALGKEIADLDLAVVGDAGAAARAIASGSAGHAFELSSEFGTWRVVEHGGGWQIDISAARGSGIEADLAERDFTVGAVAVPLGGGAPLDPFDGLGDLERGVLRAVGDRSFAADPLRLLRAARLAAELELQVDPATRALAIAEAGRAAEPAGERQLVELALILGGERPLLGLGLLDQLGITPVVLPELAALQEVEQGPNHHLDVHGHTIAVLERTLEVEADLDRFAGERAAEIAALLDEPLADRISRRTALRFAAILHDIGKPATRGERGGFVTFIGHDSVGAEMVAALCRRLRTSRAFSDHLATMTREHLRLGFLVHEAPLPPRRVHEYLRATEPVSADVTLLTIADRLSARGSGPFATEEAIRAHLDLARSMLAAALDWRRDGPPPPLLRGDELVAEVGVSEGPEVGELLAELEAAQYAGEVGTREQALALARALHG